MACEPGGTEEGLRGKRIMVVGRDYYFYTREIVAELEASFGARVSFHSIEPQSFWYRLRKKLGFPTDAWLRRHHAHIVGGARGAPPDIVLFIQVHQIGDMVADYREAFGSARFVLYYWDSIRTHDYRPYVRYFDRVFSFDRADCRRVPGAEYLPLFFSEEFRHLRGPQPTRYDMSFVGVAVSMRRYDQLQKLRAWAGSSGVSLFDYVVVSPFLYLRQLLRGRVLRRVHLRSLDRQALLRIYGASRSVLDLPNNLQSGYTMRTFEALGAHRKLVTANPEIVAEDFYTPATVFVIGPAGEMPGREFLQAQPAFSPAIDRYHLRAWLLRLLAAAVDSAGSSHPQQALAGSTR